MSRAHMVGHTSACWCHWCRWQVTPRTSREARRRRSIQRDAERRRLKRGERQAWRREAT